LEGRLGELAIERVNVIGLATQFSVEHTVRDAADMGYRVRPFADCCASGDLEAHRASLRTLSMLADVVGSEIAFGE
jgi:nicotinamidase-related amidase